MLELLDGHEHSVGSTHMRPVWVAQSIGHKNLVRLDALNQLSCNGHVIVSDTTVTKRLAGEELIL